MYTQLLRLIMIIALACILIISCEESEKDIDVMPSLTTFSKTFGGNGEDRGYSVEQTKDGGYIMTGTTESPLNSDGAFWLIKTNSEGQEEWNKVFSGVRGGVGTSVLQTIDGGYILCGSDRTSYYSDLWVIKTDSIGQEQWKQIFGIDTYAGGSSIKQTAEGGYVITGSKYFTGHGLDVWLIKIDSNGNIEWDQAFGDGGDDLASSVEQTLDGGYSIVGRTSSNSYDVLLIKTDSMGNESWIKTFGGAGADYGYSGKETMDGGLIITGFTASSGSGNRDVWLIKTDSGGNEEWNHTYGGSDSDEGYDLDLTIDSGFIIVGTTRTYGSGQLDLWLIKTDSEGNEEWEQTFGGQYEERGYSVKQTSDDGYILLGTTESLGNGTNDTNDLFLIKTDIEGNVDLPE